VLAVAPWNFFNNDCLAVAAIDTPHGIHQKDQKAPEGNELETALGELIVSRSGLMAAGTIAREPLRRRTAISMLLWSEVKQAWR